MEIEVNSLGYDFDNDGNTTSVKVGFTGNEDQSFLTSTIALYPKDLPVDSSLDDLTKNQLTELARTKLSAIVAVKQEDYTAPEA